MTISIRELTLADESELIELLDTVRPDWRDALAPAASGPLAFVSDRRSLLLGGYVDGRPAGWLWGVHIRRPDGRLMTYVHEVDVIETERGQGLATMLVEAAVGAARRAGSSRLWLVTATGNEPANALYRSVGGSTQPDETQRVYGWELT